ncbi:MAG: phenylalanine--tRNA ligase subunit beta [Breznakia sp.]
MLISRKWLQQYIDISEISIETLANKITSAGLEVEGVKRLAKGSNLVIGEVLECQDHPDSLHLHLCRVNIGSEILQIVCGAPNVRVGLKVIVAKVGAELSELVIKAGVIRGVVSNGMLCSLQELGVDATHLQQNQIDGIEELKADAPVGEEDVLAYLGLDDEVLDIGLTPNRNDCLAAFAMAKEVAAILDKKAFLPNFKDAANIGAPTKLKVYTKTAKCPLYLGKIIREVCVKESPKWMKELLLASGIKSINNVVDISNIVMLETGQPVHFFDLNKLEKEEIVVSDGWECDYVALDGETYQIQKEDLMISANHNPIAIGGIMGGHDTKIDEHTTGIVIEAASFDHVSIRNSARRLNIYSDASIRFAKKIDTCAPFYAMDRAVQLLIEYADAKLLEKSVASNEVYFENVEIDISLNNMNAVLGTNFSEAAVLDVLSRLELQPTQKDDVIHVVIPSYRQDLQVEVDIYEEVIRILGFDELPSTLPILAAGEGKLNARQHLRRNLRTILSNAGCYEAETYTLISETMKENAIMPLPDVLQLASPMSEERKYIRTSVAPSLLQTLAYNNARSIKNVALFEISNVYAKDYMEERLGILLAGNLQESRWLKHKIPADFYTMKGMIYGILENLGYNESRIVIKENTLDVKHFHPFQSACVYIGKDLLGIFGKVHPLLSKQYDCHECVIAEVNLDSILKNKIGKVKFAPISKFPSTTRDFAFVVKEAVKAQEIIQIIKQSSKLNGKSIIEHVEVFDVYMGEHVEEGYKSIAISLIFQSKEYTLSDIQINTVHDQIVANLKTKVHAQLRT